MAIGSQLPRPFVLIRCAVAVRLVKAWPSRLNTSDHSIPPAEETNSKVRTEERPNWNRLFYCVKCSSVCRKCMIFPAGERNLLMVCSCILWLVDWLTDWLIDCWFIHRFIDWLFDWLFVGSFIYQLIDWLIDRLIARSIDCLLTHLAVDWLIDWWIVWLTDCVTLSLGFEALLVNIGPVSARVYLVLFRVIFEWEDDLVWAVFFHIIIAFCVGAADFIRRSHSIIARAGCRREKKRSVFMISPSPPPPRPKSADRGAISEMDRPTGPDTITIRTAPSLTNYLSRGKRTEYELSTPCCSSWTVHQVDYVFSATPSSLLLAFLVLVCGGPYFLLSAMCLLQWFNLIDLLSHFLFINRRGSQILYGRSLPPLRLDLVLISCPVQSGRWFLLNLHAGIIPQQFVLGVF